MKMERVLVALESVAALVVLAWLSSAGSGGLVIDGLGASSLWRAAAICGALLVLGFFNVWLPRGDAVDTTVPIAFAAAVLVHPLPAAGAVLIARCATVALKPQGHTAGSAIEQVARRTMLICGAYVALSWLAPSVLGGRANPEPVQIAYIIAVAVVFIGLDVLVEQMHACIRSRTPFVALAAGAIRLQGSMLAAEMSTAVLAVMMFPALQYGSLLVTVALLLVMRQSFALLLEVRASYTSTVEVLARSLEAYDPRRRGHAERVASMVGAAGRLTGFQSRVLENMTYAALFHDVGRLGADDADEEPAVGSAHVLSGVGFLAGAIPILRVLDSAGAVDASLDENDVIGAYMIASFSAIDSDVAMGAREGRELADAIGTRLYAATRKSIDRAIDRVEREVREGSHRPSSLADVVA